MNENTIGRETVANWMILRGYATGHGDTIQDLLFELEGQLGGPKEPPPGEGDFKLLQARIEQLTLENWQLRGALGYPVPGHIPQGPFSCGLCAAKVTDISQALVALLNVRKLITEAAMTGFNCHDGDWAERLFASQAVTSAAIGIAQSHEPAGPVLNQQDGNNG